MSRKVQYKLSGEKLEAALKFSSEIGIELNLLAEKALFLVMKQAYSHADLELKAAIAAGVLDEISEGNSEGSSAPGTGETTSSTALAQPEDLDGNGTVRE
jgi:hypothetical protein